MNWEKFYPWLRLGGNLAILIGLILVYLEIQQNGTIARAELGADVGQNFFAINQQLSDPAFSKLYTKGLHAPIELTESERLQLNSLFGNVMLQFGSELRLYNLGIFAEYEYVPRRWGPWLFSSGYGKAWWNVHRNRSNPAIARIIDEELSKLDGKSIPLELDAQVMQQLGAQ